jgi:hypothetical protein
MYPVFVTEDRFYLRLAITSSKTILTNSTTLPVVLTASNVGTTHFMLKEIVHIVDYRYVIMQLGGKTLL